MPNQKLAGLLSTPPGKPGVLRIAGSVSASPEQARELLSLTFHPQYEIAFRAAWALEELESLYPQSFEACTDEFVKRYPEQANPSCRRHFTKIMMSLSANTDLIRGYDTEAVVEATFAWLIDPETPVAVQVNCMDVLYNLRKQHDWIADELRAQTEFLLRNGGPAMQSRGKRVLEKLK